MMKQNKKIIIIGCLFVAIVIGTFGLIKMTNSKKANTDVPASSYVDETGKYIDTRQPTDVNQNLTMLSPDNSVLAGTDWFDNQNAPLIFVDGEHWVWYKEAAMNSENAISGTYETYYGSNAYDTLDENLFNAENARPTASENAIVIKLKVLSIKDGGEEILENPNVLTLMGTVTDFSLSLIDVYNLNKYELNAEQNVDIEQADLEANKILEDIVYTENMEAWKSFDLKVNGENLSYPYSSHALSRAGLTYSEPNESNGLTSFNLNGKPVGEGIFLNKAVDSLSYLNLKETEGLDVVLPNGITWGDGEEEILKAYGEPSQIVRGSINEKVYRYNLDNMQMELFIYTEDCNYGTALGLMQVSINDFVNE